VSSNASMRVITLGQFRRRSAADIVRSLKSPHSNSVKTATQMLRGEVPRARRCRVAFAIRWRLLKRDPWQAASARTYRIFHHLRAISVHLNSWYRPLAQALVQFGEQICGWCAAKCPRVAPSGGVCDPVPPRATGDAGSAALLETPALSRVLFREESTSVSDLSIDMQLIFASAIVGHAATRLFCVGRVGRIVEPDRFIRPHAGRRRHRPASLHAGDDSDRRVRTCDLTFPSVFETLKQKSEAMPCVE